MFWAAAAMQLMQQDLPLGWLEGTWCSEPAADAQTCETWTPMTDGVMRGSGTTRKGAQVTVNETMTITAGESGMVFHAEPANQKPTDFRAAKLDAAARSVRFENAAHDYPQRVRYWREGEALHAEISLLDGSKAMRWTFHRSE